ncbi:MAG: hypothetical protein QT01_C0001G0130 [archaeon GW2011_AR6]|nr:MAG: hypothetical protein QT01_C0001G0130 [archaeon GW2011_AR6]
MVVREAFGRKLEFEDIYNHLTLPDEVHLLKIGAGKEIVAMRGYSRRVLSGLQSLILEGAAILPEMQGNGVYGKMLEQAHEGESVLCLRTQNPRLYAAFEKFCDKVYPGFHDTPRAVREIQKAFAEYLGCDADENGIVREYYGGLFYGEEPYHERISPLFMERLKMDLHKGDAVLVLGVKEVEEHTCQPIEE